MNLKVNDMAKRKALPQIEQHNFVAKHMHEVNRSQVFTDRKKDLKRGYQKHKQERNSMEDRLFYWVSYTLC